MKVHISLRMIDAFIIPFVESMIVVFATYMYTFHCSLFYDADFIALLPTLHVETYK